MQRIFAPDIKNVDRYELEKAEAATDCCPIIAGLSDATSPTEMIEFLAENCPVHLKFDAPSKVDPFTMPELVNNEANIAFISPRRTIYFVHCTVKSSRSRWLNKLQVAFTVKGGLFTEVCIVNKPNVVLSAYMVAHRSLLQSALNHIMSRFHRPTMMFNRNPNGGVRWSAKLKYDKPYAVALRVYSKTGGIVHKVAKLTEIDTVALLGVRTFGFVLPAIGEFRLTIIEERNRRHLCHRSASPLSTTSIVDGTTSIISECQYNSFVEKHERLKDGAVDETLETAILVDPYFLKDIGETE